MLYKYIFSVLAGGKYHFLKIKNYAADIYFLSKVSNLNQAK